MSGVKGEEYTLPKTIDLFTFLCYFIARFVHEGQVLTTQIHNEDSDLFALVVSRWRHRLGSKG